MPPEFDEMPAQRKFEGAKFGRACTSDPHLAVVVAAMKETLRAPLCESIMRVIDAVLDGKLTLSKDAFQELLVSMIVRQDDLHAMRSAVAEGSRRLRMKGWQPPHNDESDADQPDQPEETQDLAPASPVRPRAPLGVSTVGRGIAKANKSRKCPTLNSW